MQNEKIFFWIAFSELRRNQWDHFWWRQWATKHPIGLHVGSDRPPLAIIPHTKLTKIRDVSDLPPAQLCKSWAHPKFGFSNPYNCFAQLYCPEKHECDSLSMLFKPASRFLIKGTCKFDHSSSSTMLMQPKALKKVLWVPGNVHFWCHLPQAKHYGNTYKERGCLQTSE